MFHQIKIFLNSQESRIKNTMLYIPPGKCSGYGLVDVLKEKYNDDPIVGLEIGCAAGDTSEWLLRSLPNLQWIGVDPYTDYVDWNTNYLINQESAYQNFADRIVKKNPDRTKFYRMTSDDAVKEILDESLDFVFIDGIHTYEQVKKDCISFFPKVKKGGLFSGHDFTTIAAVNKAVLEFKDAVDPTIQIKTADFDVWYWWK